MKTQMFRVWVLGVAITSLALGTGCHHEQARAEVPDVDKLVPELNPSPVFVAQVDPAPAPADPAADLEKAKASTNAPMPKLVANPVIPEHLNASPALQEVLKLAQAGVSEEVIMAYIVHSTNLFNVGSDAIVYLNDLGVSNNVITALIHHDSTPEMQARRQAANAVQPLPAGVALNTPATNVYPPAVTTTPTPAFPDSSAAPPPPANAEVTNVTAPAEEPANVSYFYSSLAPYGTWVEVEDYGLCWQPTVVVSNPGWRPYLNNGRWIWSNHGWYWYSDYSWGWAPFHYGRWHDYPRLGWIWVPDTHWGPSWVSWRYSSSYCGWAPLPPACVYRPGFGFSYYGSSYGWSFGFDFGLSYHHYNYVPVNRFCDRSLGIHVYRGDRARVIHNQTTVVNNYVVGNNNTVINNGVGRDRIAAVTRGQVPTATVREGTARGSVRREQIVNEGSSLAIVRPTLPAKPERSQVAVPNRSGISRVSSDAAALNNLSGRNAGGTANGIVRPNSSGIGGNRTAAPAVVNRQSGTPSATRSTERVTSSESRPIASANRGESGNGSGASAPVTPTPRPRSAEAVVRPNSSTYRSYARPAETRGSEGSSEGASSAPAAAHSSVAPRAVPRPNVSASSPVMAGPAPAASAPRAAAPSSPGVRSYANPGAVSRPSAAAPQVSRPAPSVSAPAARPSYSAPVSRPEPSRSAPSYSAPSRPSPSPSYSAPSRSAPSYSAPSRSSSSYSPPRPNSSGFGGGGQGRGVGRGRD